MSKVLLPAGEVKVGTEIVLSDGSLAIVTNVGSLIEKVTEDVGVSIITYKDKYGSSRNLAMLSNDPIKVRKTVGQRAVTLASAIHTWWNKRA